MKTRIRKLTEQEKRSLGEQQMIADWLKIFPKRILSIVADTFDLWKLITEYLPKLKEEILARDGKLVCRPDSGDPIDIICGKQWDLEGFDYKDRIGLKYKDSNKIIVTQEEYKGVIELLWDIFGGTINEQGYKVLDPHIGAIYGDSITPERQKQIYERLAAKGFAATNITLGIGSYSMTGTTRDWASYATKGSWFEVEVPDETSGGNLRFDSNNRKWYKSYNTYKDPVTDDGVKRSLKGLLQVKLVDDDYVVNQECSWEQEEDSELRTIYEDGKFFNITTLNEIRERLIKQ